jgi:hypothetical protein
VKLDFDTSHIFNLTMQPSAGSSFVNFMKLLSENRFHVSFPFLPRAMYVGLMTALLTPFRVYERLKFSKKLDAVEIPSPIFIIGHFRSGTTFLHYLFGQDPFLSYVSTCETMAPWVFLGSGNMFEKLVGKYLPEKRPMDDLEANATLPYEEEYAIANLCNCSFYNGWYFPRAIHHYFSKYVLFENISNDVIKRWQKAYRHLLKKITYKYGNKRTVLKSPVNTAKIRYLLDIFPDAQFIHISRNPYEVYFSTWRLYEKIMPIFSFQNIERETLDDLIINFYRGVYKKYFAERKLIPQENLIEISYENFYTNPLQNLQSLYELLGLEHFNQAKPRFEQYVNQHKNYRPHSYEDVDVQIKDKIYKEWKFAFNEFGYPR